MRQKLLALAASVALVLGALTADAAPATQYWINAKVSGKPGNLTLANSSGTFSVGTDTPMTLQGVISTKAGHWVRVRVVFEAHATLKVTGILGENDSNKWLKIQGATDDDGAIGWIKKGGFFVITGDVAAEEEEGGYLYYTVPVAKGGASAGPYTGYVRADFSSVVSF